MNDGDAMRAGAVARDGCEGSRHGAGHVPWRLHSDRRDPERTCDRHGIDARGCQPVLLERGAEVRTCDR